MAIDHLMFPVYRYEVFFEKIKTLGFKSVSGLKLAAAYEPLEVGGVNDGPVLLRMPVKDTGKLVFERGKYLIESSNSFMFFPGQQLGNEMDIFINDHDGTVGAIYTVRQPKLETIELSTLDAMDSSVLIEKLTIVHRGIYEI